MKRKDAPTEEHQALRVLVSDDLGLIKAVQAPGVHRLQDATVASHWGQPDRGQNAAQCLAVCSSSQEGGFPLVAVGRVSGKISLLNGHTGQDCGEIGPASTSGSQDDDRSMCSLHFLRPAEGGSGQPRLLSCTCGGLVQIHEAGPSGQQEEASAPSWTSSAQWSVPRDVQATAVDEDERLLAVACRGTELTLWDLATRQRAYLAKSAKPDRVGLVEPPWCTAVAFVPGSSGTKVVVGTGKHKLRVYDTKGRRPALQLAWGQARVTALAAERDGGRVWAANAAGQVEALNLGTGRMEGALKGATGSVRALALHPGPEPILASVGLDRFLRLHSTASRKQLAAVYLKQKLTGLAWCPPAEGAAAQQETAGAGMAGEAGEQLHGDGARRGRKRAKAASK